MKKDLTVDCICSSWYFEQIFKSLISVDTW